VKTIPSGLQTELSSDLAYLTTLWKIVRKDGTIFRFTDHDQPISIVGDGTYLSSLSYSRTAIRTGFDMQPDNLEIEGLLDSTEIAENDLRAGKFDTAAIYISAISWANPANGVAKLRAGIVGKIHFQANRYQAELRGLNQYLQQQVGTVYQAGCRNDLGDTICGFDTSTVTFAGTVTSVTDRRTFRISGAAASYPGPSTKTYTASTVSFGGSNKNQILDSANGFLTGPHAFAALEAIKVSGAAFNDTTRTAKSVAAGKIVTYESNVNKERAGNPITLSVTTPGYYDFGLCVWQTGSNVGLPMEIKSWTGPTGIPSGQVTLYLPMPFAIQVGDTLTLTAGCDKRITTCASSKFGSGGNVLGPGGVSGGFNGEPYVPGQDAVLNYPNAH
jgi:uncharacterized phage protein (TIGR02218 family)